MDYYTAWVKQQEADAKRAVELAKISAERDAALAKVKAEAEKTLAVASAQAQEAAVRAETDLIRTRAEHADNEQLIRAHERSLEQIRQQGFLRVATLACGTVLIAAILALAC